MEEQPVTYNHPSPYEANVQTPVIYQNPVIYDAIDGDSTGQNTGFSAPNWITNFILKVFTSRLSSRNTRIDNICLSDRHSIALWNWNIWTCTNGEQGSVHMKYYTGGSSAYALIYYNVVSIGDQISGYPTGVSPDVNDTWAVHVKYTASRTASKPAFLHLQSITK